jgi:hypothetical protein
MFDIVMHGTYACTIVQFCANVYFCVAFFRDHPVFGRIKLIIMVVGRFQAFRA